MHFSTSKIYDTVVIGAGIAGCCAAFALEQKGQRVLLIDRSAAPASGGSGAAGAFVSPKIGKGGSLQQLTNDAFEYAKDFYLLHFPKYFHQSGLLRLPRDEEDANKFSLYEQYNTNKYKTINHRFLEKNGIKNERVGFWFKDAGVCDAPEMCRAIWERVEFRQFDVSRLICQDRQEYIWELTSSATTETIQTKNVVLSTGHQNDIVDMRYMGVKGTWGSRGDYTSKSPLDISLHKRISISKNINGIIKLGATHVKAKEPCVVCDGKPLATLELQASDIIDSSDLTLKEIFCGMRSGSHDYLPLVGRVVDVGLMSEKYPKIFMGAKPELEHFDGMYILNGMGGRGFVFAPLMSKWLAGLIVDSINVDKRVNPDRLFLKWTRKLRAR